MNGISDRRHPRQNEPDLQIDAVLHAIGAVAPAADLSDRITAKLRQAGDPSPRTRSLSRRPTPLPAIAWLSIAAACVAVMVGAVLLHLSGRTSRDRVGHAQSSASRLHPAQAMAQTAPTAVPQAASSQSPAPRPSGSTVPQARPTDATTLASAPAQMPAQPLVFQLAVTASASSSGSDVPTQASLDAQALEDLHAPSQLAPQMPSTSQERLVRLMLRHGEKHDLAQLDPAERAAFAQQQTRAFNSFFNPPVPPPETSLANRVYAPHALTLDEVREIDAARPPATTPSTTQPPPTGDSK